jgi:hypothetical protein
MKMSEPQPGTCVGRAAAIRAAARALSRVPRVVLRRAFALARRMPFLSRYAEWAYVIARVRRDYRKVHGHAPSLLRPRGYSEKMQWRKLFELDPLFPVLSDKLAARAFVAARIGPGRQADLLWAGNDPRAIPFDHLAPPFVLKSTHGSGQILSVKHAGSLEVAAARAAARQWLGYCRGTGMIEPGYLHLPRRLMVERLLLAQDGSAPWEHRVMTFNGRAVFIRSSLPGPDGLSRVGVVHSRDWDRLPISWDVPALPTPLPRPARLAEFINIAERLGAGLVHCRVDIYECADGPRVGEITLYSQSGLSRYEGPDADARLGAPWLIPHPALRALWTVATRRWDIRLPADFPGLCATSRDTADSAP